jgi:hypothetical protein
MAMVIDQMWECPKCGMQFGMGPPARLQPPTCSSLHEATEMEQITAPRWRGEDADDA